MVVADRGDQLFGGSANDHIYGEGGDDVIIGGGGDDVLAGGAGIDIVDGTLHIEGTRYAEHIQVLQGETETKLGATRLRSTCRSFGRSTINRRFESVGSA